jgi:phage-related protein
MGKDLIWMGGSLKDLKALPKEVQLEVGHALREAQDGGKANTVKPLKGKGYGASVLEIVEDHDTNTYRCVYTVRFEEAIYVLHSFQKKSTQGIKTPQREIDVVEARLKDAEELHRRWLEAQKTSERQARSERPRREK